MDQSAPPSALPAAPAAPRFAMLQAGRGIAALAVAIFHCSYIIRETYHQTGWIGGRLAEVSYVGVDFFFVLSGFIITFIHDKDAGQPARFVPFAIKRVIRIYPVWLAAVGGKLLLSLFWAGAIPAGKLETGYVVRSLLLLPTVERPVIDAGWTLQLEMLFYAVMGLVILLPKGFWHIAMPAWAAAVIVANLNHFPADQPWTYVVSPFVLDFLAGCLVCRYRHHLASKKVCAAALAIGVLLFAWGAYEHDWIFHSLLHGRLFFGGAFCALLAAIVGMELLGSIKTPAWLRSIGDASYSIYVLNTSVVKAVVVAGGKISFLNQAPWFALWGLALAASVGVGMVFSRLFEQPALRWLRARLVKHGA